MFHCNVPANAGYACAFQRFHWDGVGLMPFAQSDPKVVCQPMSQKLLLSFRFPLHSAWGSFRASKLASPIVEILLCKFLRHEN